MNERYREEYYKAYEIAMSFLESESSKRRAQIGSKAWLRLREDLNFLDKSKADCVINWLMENWPPKRNRILPHLSDREQHAFDSKAHKILLRSYRTGMISPKMLDDFIARSHDFDDMHFSETYMQSCLLRVWVDSIHNVKNKVFH